MRSRALSLSLLLLAGSILLFSSCRYRKGNGNIVTIEKQVDPFDEVEVHGAIDVYATSGDHKAVRIEGDENLLRYIIVEDHHGEIEIRTKSGVNLRPTQKIKVYVSAPQYAKLEVTGACNIIGENQIRGKDRLEVRVTGAGNIKMDVDAPDLKAEISGAGKMALTGRTRDFDAQISGAGKVSCYELLAERTKVEISGAGSAEVYASVSLDAQVSGAGNVRYRGEAQDIKQQLSGAGSIKKAE